MTEDKAWIKLKTPCWKITYGDGRAPSLPFDPQATGLILYTNDGWMNACIARDGRTN